MSEREKCKECPFCGYDPAPDCIYYCFLGRTPLACEMLQGRAGNENKKRSLASRSDRRKKRKGA
jgi:hypothetical protein